MGIVASVAPFKLLYPMLKDPWTSLFRVTFIANVSIKFVYFSQAGAGSTSVRCMAVGASQRPLDDTVIVRKIELGLHVRMAGETEVGIFDLQELLGDLRSVNLMAIITSNST